MAGTLLLGPVLFRDFELPGQITWGGKQRLAVHHLPGGRRVIDAMGRDDAAIVWSGTFSGADAGERARLLDLMCAEGAAWPLVWGRFLYTVIVQDFSVAYERANWMPYRIVCAVLRDEAEGLVEDALSLLQSVSADLASAGAPMPLTQDATRLGTPAYTAALASVSGVTTSAHQSLMTADAAAGGDLDLASAGDVAGTLAQAAFARGFAARALGNLANAAS